MSLGAKNFQGQLIFGTHIYHGGDALKEGVSVFLDEDRDSLTSNQKILIFQIEAEVSRKKRQNLYDALVNDLSATSHK